MNNYIIAKMRADGELIPYMVHNNDIFFGDETDAKNTFKYVIDSLNFDGKPTAGWKVYEISLKEIEIV